MNIDEPLAAYFGTEEYAKVENGDRSMVLYYATTSEMGIVKTRYQIRNLTSGKLLDGSFNGEIIRWHDSENLLIEEYLGVANENSNGKRSYTLNPETGEKKSINSISNEDQ
ncbi:MAG: hypothetical protein ACJA2C_000231 [Marinoscillum sp.]|jgi:hypothetical protein